MRLAMLISPSRVSSSTVPISRMYMRTGSVVRPSSASSAARGSGGFLDGLFVGGLGILGGEQRFRIRRLLVHGNAHVVDHVDDVFDLFRIDDLAGQVVVHLRIGEEALFLAERDQQLELRLPLFGHDRSTTLDGGERFGIAAAFRTATLAARLAGDNGCCSNRGGDLLAGLFPAWRERQRPCLWQVRARVRGQRPCPSLQPALLPVPQQASQAPPSLPAQPC